MPRRNFRELEAELDAKPGAEERRERHRKQLAREIEEYEMTETEKIDRPNSYIQQAQSKINAALEELKEAEKVTRDSEDEALRISLATSHRRLRTAAADLANIALYLKGSQPTIRISTELEGGDEANKIVETDSGQQEQPDP